ncbi:PQQ-binding-like beta-propeller repeat protein [Salinirubellus sp. GCM10025818]|uniref:PQQ-binding-like beta-propeller repeat protein n=1 Tax=Salinirubellus TaxID=2162630 RepID=UPI0030D38825
MLSTDSGATRRRLLRAAAAGGAATLAGCAGVDDGSPTPGSDASTEWPYPAFDPQATAYAPDAAAPRSGVTERWAVETPRPTDRPVVAEERVFLPGAAGLHALDLATGESVWTVGPGDQPWTNAPAVVDGTVYATFRERPGVLALDPEDGTERWRADVGPVSSSPVADGEGRCYVGTRDGGLVALDAGTGEVAWSYDLFGEVVELTFRLPTLVAGTTAGEVYALYDSDGPRELWRRKVGGKVVALARTGGDALVSAFGGKLRRLANGAHAGSDRWANRDGGTAQGGLAVAAGLVFGGNGGGLTACDVRGGETAWSAPGRFAAGPAAAGDTVYAGREGEVIAFAHSGGVGVGGLSVGRKRWSHPVSGTPLEGLAVADGAVVAVTGGGEEGPPRTYVLDPA